MYEMFPFSSLLDFVNENRPGLARSKCIPPAGDRLPPIAEQTNLPRRTYPVQILVLASLYLVTAWIGVKLHPKGRASSSLRSKIRPCG